MPGERKGHWIGPETPIWQLSIKKKELMMTRGVRYSGPSLLLFLAASCRPTTQSPPSPATGDKAATSPSPQAPHQGSSSAAAPMPDAEQTLGAAADDRRCRARKRLDSLRSAYVSVVPRTRRVLREASFVVRRSLRHSRNRYPEHAERPSVVGSLLQVAIRRHPLDGNPRPRRAHGRLTTFVGRLRRQKRSSHHAERGSTHPGP